jgi:hypothetical protein
MSWVEIGLIAVSAFSWVRITWLAKYHQEDVERVAKASDAQYLRLEARVAELEAQANRAQRSA